MNILFEIDHGARVCGRPFVLVRGWYVDRTGKRHERRHYVERFAADMCIRIAKTKIAEELRAL